jgi:uncharacterized membrane protein
MTYKKNRNHLLIVLALLLASIISVTLVALRAIYSDQVRYTFLVWNLFLAWVPLLTAWVAYRWQNRMLPLLFSGSMWLLFFPNALYLVTDLIHLREDGVVPIWFDAFMIFSFVLTGLLIGLLSLFLMQTIVSRRCGRLYGWVFVLSTLGMSSYGVYVGRFLRWNSWDIFAHPLTLLHDISASLIHPQMMLKTYTVSILLSIIFTFAYVVLFSLPRLVLESSSD